MLPPFDEYAATLVGVFLVHCALSSMWQLSVPSLGFAPITYGSLLVGCGFVLIGLARWGALV